MSYQVIESSGSEAAELRLRNKWVDHARVLAAAVHENQTDPYVIVDAFVNNLNEQVDRGAISGRVREAAIEALLTRAERLGNPLSIEGYSARTFEPVVGKEKEAAEPETHVEPAKQTGGTKVNKVKYTPAKQGPLSDIIAAIHRGDATETIKHIDTLFASISCQNTARVYWDAITKASNKALAANSSHLLELSRSAIVIEQEWGPGGSKATKVNPNAAAEIYKRKQQWLRNQHPAELGLANKAAQPYSEVAIALFSRRLSGPARDAKAGQRAAMASAPADVGTKLAAE